MEENVILELKVVFLYIKYFWKVRNWLLLIVIKDYN